MVRLVWRGGLLSIFDRRFQRLCVAAALVAAVGLAGCGRKGALDPPPSAGSAVPLTEDGQLMPSATSESSKSSDKKGSSRRTKAKDVPFVLDWLVD